MKCIIHRAYIRIIQLSKFNLYLLRSIILLDSTRKTFEKEEEEEENIGTLFTRGSINNRGKIQGSTRLFHKSDDK